MIDPGDVDQEPFTSGWVPDGWEKGEPIELNKGFKTFGVRQFHKRTLFINFDNWRLPAFYDWLEWWNDD